MSRDSGSRTVTTRFVWLPHGSAAGWLLLHRTVTDHGTGATTDEFWRSERISPGAVASGAFQDSGPEWHRIVTGEPVPFLLWPFFLAAVTDRELPAVREQLVRSPVRPIADISAEVRGAPDRPEVTTPKVVLANDPFGPEPGDLDLGDGWDVTPLDHDGRREDLLAAVQGRIRHARIPTADHGDATVWINRFLVRGADSPDRSSPGPGSPDRSLPGAGSPDRSSPGAGSPDRSSPGAGSPDRSSPGADSPDHSSPGADSPDRSLVSGPAVGGPASASLDEVLAREPVRRAIAGLLGAAGDESARRALVAEFQENGWTLVADPLRLSADEPAAGFLGRLVFFCQEGSTVHRIATMPACAETLRRRDGLADTLARQLCPLNPAAHDPAPTPESLWEALRTLPAEWDMAHPGIPGLAPPAWDEITTVTSDDGVSDAGDPPRRPVEISHVELVDSNGRHSWRIDLSAPVRPRTDADR
ncbi:hypothetical protein AB0M36_13245 [Actinoplanes sp. NPDC051346]|uniref:hypothetical protein n=1 Tax=Actinoplanes sp. NPDC051346 TaxID=3155048 RepID=UPI003449A246